MRRISMLFSLVCLLLVVGSSAEAGCGGKRAAKKAAKYAACSQATVMTCSPVTTTVTYTTYVPVMTYVTRPVMASPCPTGCR